MNKGKKLKPEINSHSHSPSESFLLQAQIKNPQRLKMLILSGSNLARNDFMFIMTCKNLIKLDLSSNGLVRFPKQFSLSSLQKLSFLHLHSNQFRNIQDLKPVFQTTNLIQLTLSNNPLPINPRIQHFILNVLKKLRVINDRVIFEQQRLPDVIVTRPIVRLDMDQILPASQESDEKYYIWLLEVQFFCIQTNWVKANPIVKIQRLWRKYWKRKTMVVTRPIRYTKKIREVVREDKQDPSRPLLRTMFSQWKEFSDNMRKIRKNLEYRNKEYMIQPLKQYNEYQRNQRVSSIVHNFVNRIRHKVKVKSALSVLQHYLIPRVMMFQSPTCFLTVTGIEEAGRIMFSKNQRHLLLNFIELYKRSHPGKDPKWSIQLCKSYVAVRQVEQERLGYKKNDGFYPLMIHPSMKCIFLKNRKSSARKAKTTTVAIRQLSYLTKKNAQQTQQERQRSNKKYERLCRYIENEYYNNLMEFECRDRELFQDIIRLSYYHNTGSCKFEKITKNTEALSFLDNYSQRFVFYFDKILRRTTAAVHIQKCWKRYWNNKTCKQTLYTQIIRTRAAQKLQRFARNQQFSHRVSFDTSLNAYLREINRSSLYMQIEVYLELKKFLCKLPLYSKMATWVNHTKKDILITWEYPRSPFFPKTLQKIGESVVNQGDSVAPADIYFLLHFCAKSSLITDANGKSRYIRLDYKSLQSAKKTCAFLALLTYQFKTGFFLRLFTRDLLLDEQYISRYAERMKMIHNVELQSVDSKALKEKPIVIEDAAVIGIKGRDYGGKEVLVECFQQEDHNSKPRKEGCMFVVKIGEDKKILPESKANLEVPRLENLPTEKEETDQKIVSSLRKNFEKRLSFYDITIDPPSKARNRSNSKGSSQANSLYDPIIDHNEHKQTDQLQKLNQTDWLRQTHRQAEKMRQQHTLRMMDNSQREKIQLGRLRKLYTQEKSRNLNMKFLKQSQEMATNRLKVEKIDQKTKEMRATRQAESQHEGSFLQKGNFLMKQEAKMKRIRDSYIEDQRRKQSVNKQLASRGQATMTTQHLRTRNIGSRASMSEDRQREKSQTSNHQQLRHPSPRNIVLTRRNSAQTPVPPSQRLSEVQNTPPSSYIVPAAQQQQAAELIQSSATQDVYKIIRKKDKMIHAVFPEQFYAIDKRSTQIGLPRLQHKS